MRVYVAAPWTRKSDARTAALILEQYGFTITVPWWDHHETHNPKELHEQATADFDGVVGADALVLLNLEMSEGKAVETGIAIASGIPVFVVGDKTNVFHNLDGAVLMFQSLDMAIGALQMLRRERGF